MSEKCYSLRFLPLFAGKEIPIRKYGMKELPV